jgi:Tfp pilus assembly protein PilV
MRPSKNLHAFALYEVLLGLAIFVIGVMSLGRAVQNCLNASALSQEENRVRQILGNRMSEVQASPIHPDPSKVTKVDTGFGTIKLTQRTVPEELIEPDNTVIDGISRVTLTAEWSRGGVKQSKQLVFYVYRAG